MSAPQERTLGQGVAPTQECFTEWFELREGLERGGEGGRGGTAQRKGGEQAGPLGLAWGVGWSADLAVRICVPCPCLSQAYMGYLDWCQLFGSWLKLNPGKNIPLPPGERQPPPRLCRMQSKPASLPAPMQIRIGLPERNMDILWEQLVPSRSHPKGFAGKHLAKLFLAIVSAFQTEVSAAFTEHLLIEIHIFYAVLCLIDWCSVVLAIKVFLSVAELFLCMSLMGVHKQTKPS